MLEKNLEEIEKQDIEQLVSAAEMESRRLEFKLELPGNKDKDKHEFVSDLSALSNSDGGLLIYGVREEEGRASEAVGLENFSEDPVRLRLEQLLRAYVTPRTPGVSFKVVDGFRKGPVLIVSVPRSWIGPHMVTVGGSSRFYARASNGKFQLDVQQIRAAFETSSDLPNRIEAWRTERISRVIGGDTPVPMYSKDCLVVHLVPLEAVRGDWRFSAKDLYGLMMHFMPMDAGGTSYRYNLDGVLASDKHWEDQSKFRSYTQVFRTGAVEAVLNPVLDVRDGNPMIASVWYEELIVSACNRYFFNGMRRMGVGLPVLLMVSLVGVKGAGMNVGRNYVSSRARLSRIDRDNLILPASIFEDFDQDLSETVRPIFDAVWNACGWAASLNFNDAGCWSDSMQR